MNNKQMRIENERYFQDWVMKLFYREGIPLMLFSSKEFQVKEGEGIAGIELKHDHRFESTGNFYIEVAEKSSPDDEYWKHSGIYSKDNAWLYVIGDYKKLFVMSKKQLQYAHSLNKYAELFGYGQDPDKPTSKGFLLPVDVAETFYAIKIIKGETS